MPTYSPILIEHCENPKNVGALDPADAVGSAGRSGQGRFLSLSLRVADGRIVDAKYRSQGCAITTACGSLLTEYVIVRTIAECRQFHAEALTRLLDGLPVHKSDCAAFAIEALCSALQQIASAPEECPCS